jgi:hypothetical protein
MSRYIKAGILAGVVLFIWGFVSWVVFPWHAMTIHHFNSDVAVSQSIQTNAPISGIYILPLMSQGEKVQNNAPQAQPLIFASVRLNNNAVSPMAMNGPVLINFLTQVIAGILVAWLLSRTQRLSYLGRVGFVLIVALTACVIKDIPSWIWLGFDMQYTLVMIGDTLVGWFLAGLVLAKYIR